MPLDEQRSELPRWVWLWMPIGLAALIGVARLVEPRTGLPLYGERGVIEILTVVFLVVSIFAGVSILTDRRPELKWTRRWALLLTLGCVYFLGEELSWGQHIFGWATPEFWAAINRQGETNLHNVHGLFATQPRNALTAAVIVGLLGTLGSRLAGGEAKEMFLALYLTLYLWSLKVRIGGGRSERFEARLHAPLDQGPELGQDAGSGGQEGSRP